jgi:hypothetical protein
MTLRLLGVGTRDSYLLLIESSWCFSRPSTFEEVDKTSEKIVDKTSKEAADKAYKEAEARRGGEKRRGEQGIMGGRRES